MGCWMVWGCGLGSTLGCVPVDFLSDAVAARYGRFDGPPARVELEKVFFLEFTDRYYACS